MYAPGRSDKSCSMYNLFTVSMRQGSCVTVYQAMGVGMVNNRQFRPNILMGWSLLKGHNTQPSGHTGKKNSK